MPLACIGIGSNQGDPPAQLATALKHLQALPHSQLDRVSRPHRSPPWPPDNPVQQADFLNAVAGLQTTLAPDDLLARLQQIEQQMGRVRRQKWGPRTIDLDILCYGQHRRNSPHLQLPHPHFHRRAFVLQPLAELYPDLRIAGHPVTSWLTRLHRPQPKDDPAPPPSSTSPPTRTTIASSPKPCSPPAATAAMTPR
ncbi:MAG: 2-amino-4-hydroxy-6-hydroxymethyldihydropteridine diphosphokinase [Cellvibrionales bacterium]|nr:2-amino-4-hydroxy-6-hydroxymethyldihydropteridine diphosphokinase [Cellvibrionales bacterium]